MVICCDTMLQTAEPMFLNRKLSTAALLVVGLLIVGGRTMAEEVLTNASQVLALPSERAARAIPISITGVVTAAEPGWGGRFFVQDASAGVFVNNTNGIEPLPGDVIAISGVSMPGGYAPCIDLPHCRRLGTAPLPPAKAPTIERFMAGTEDS